MKRSINYLMSGPAHLPYLLVSLQALRHPKMGAWTDIIRVHCWPESEEIVRMIAEDSLLDIEVCPRNPEYRGKNAQFLDKMMVLKEQPEQDAAYLDADTMPVKPIIHLFTPLSYATFVATQFNEWYSNQGMPLKRVSRLKDRPLINQAAVHKAMNMPIPSPNGGVWARRNDTVILDKWYEQTWENRDLFIADEVVLHALVAEYINTDISVTGRGYYNSSPKFFTIPEKDVYLWHFHGDSNVRPQKSQKGFDLWWPVWQECIANNVGRVVDWKDQITNKHMDRLTNATP